MDREILKNILRILTLTCDQAAQLMSQAQDIHLNRLERWALSVHLLICKFCRKYNRQLKLLRAVLTRMADSRTYDDVVMLTKKIQKNLDSM
jgi:predicted anti-sigma-YlaC factor YlaD